MRCFRFSGILILAAATACSSAALTSGSDQIGASRVAIAAGDGQSAAPGAVLPTALQVLVEDSAGHGVAGVAVHFSVDSGGGSVASSSVTTGGDGLASAGKWTLGAASGMNVVSANVGSLPPAKFHALAFGATARTIFGGTVVAAGGGTLTYTKAGDALNGLTIAVPGAAYPVSTTWSVVADSSIVVHLPAGFSQVGPVLLIGNGQGYADSLVSLTMPMTVPLTDAVAPFYFDPATGTLEPITIVARNATSATLATRHFSVDLMAIPGAAPAGLHSASLRTFGAVHVVWIRLPASALQGTYATGFQPLQDNWEFLNTGDFLSARGNCEGMSITEMYYYYFVKQAGRPSLYHHFDQSLMNPWDNVQGNRFAGSVQSDYLVVLHSGIDQIAALDRAGAANGVPVTTLTASWIALTMKLTGQPVLMGLNGDNGGHAVVAFKVTTTGTTATVFFADPNFPTLSRGMVFEGTQLQAIQMQPNATSAAKTFTEAYALGVSGEIPLREVDARWTEFLAKKAGSDHYPAGYKFQIYDSLSDDYLDLTATGTGIDTFRLSVPAFSIRLRCPTCPVPLGVQPVDLQHTQVRTDSGTTLKALDLTQVSLHEGANDFTVVGFARRTTSDDPNDPGVLDSRNFTVIYRAVKIAPDDPSRHVDTAYRFTATNGGLAQADTKFTWSFGDGSSPSQVNVTGDSSVTHVFADSGKFIVRVQLHDPNGVLLGHDSMTVHVQSLIYTAWRFDQATVVSSTLPPGGIGIERTDTLALGLFTDWISSLGSTPGNSLLVLRNDVRSKCGLVAFEQFSETAAFSGEFTAGHTFGFFADNCVDPDGIYLGTFQAGPMGAGVLSGEIHHGALPDGVYAVPGGSMQATMQGTALSGTLIWRSQFSTGIGTYTIQFHAVQIQQTTGAGLRAPPPGAAQRLRLP